jgi:isopentenyl-diphosphate delta-isomerase
MTGGKKTKKRKDDHIHYSLEKEVQSLKAPGFNDVDLIHNAVPEVNFDEIETKISLFGKPLDYPLIISAITGGTERAKKINENIARVCKKYNIGMGVGSQRAMVEDPSLTETYQIRDHAPQILLIANLGLPQFILGYTEKEAKEAVKSIDADILAVHLNALQEIVQPEGDTAFKGGLAALRSLKKKVSFPVIAKETGAGIARETAENLAFLDGIDVGGRGGTSFSAVEYYRVESSQKKTVKCFWDWGIPTVQSIVETRQYAPILIATGGIRTGMDMAKALALGADCCGIAHPVLKTAENYTKLEKIVGEILLQLKKTMFLTGSETVQELKKTRVVVSGTMREVLEIRGYGKILKKFLMR